ncbi:hypothetical protein B0H10DRAFT_1967861 [Mycena sp. CBHHK59/15]|nr:hypothetical protein B0H10DRAFT_1967861 [Mycena sp. CBHHK59/15]
MDFQHTPTFKQFGEDPLAHAILSEWPSATSDRAIEFFKLQISSSLADGEVFTVGKDSILEGVAVVFGCRRDMKQFIDTAYGLNHQHDSSYLLLLEVRPSSQQKGLGTELHCRIQTNPKFYEKLGFKEVSKVTYTGPYGGIDQWAYKASASKSVV